MEIQQEVLMAWGIKIGLALVILVVGNFIAKTIVNLVKKALAKKQVDAAVVSFAGSIIYVIGLLAVLIASMSQLGIDTTSLVAVIGAAGLAIGLALQGSLSNFASGVLIVVLRPFKAGDFVEVGNRMGTVMEIKLFATKLKTPDNKIVIVPNSSITGNAITNFSTQETRRVDLLIGISYDADIRKAKSVIEELVASDERVLKDPAWTIAVSELADSSVNLIVRPWVKTPDYWPVYWHLIENIKIKLDENDITIPYPQMDVYLHKTEN
ncbi:mechanosensitive ion channel family protein [Planctobacterium marinum]|uniref:mechanosensitive ion channel family protein n=1 Tax=Planctobacterium marinum TaxID=1631968 RepID=UPI001E480B39|nr:mechanosensitive ion channel domain-containing protein [Planctobacterium marinum]MCC2604221.1 mechanosensitive ion channel [Planctobacterium marinum]